jgi:hypothetical protein
LEPRTFAKGAEGDSTACLSCKTAHKQRIDNDTNEFQATPQALPPRYRPASKITCLFLLVK